MSTHSVLAIALLLSFAPALAAQQVLHEVHGTGLGSQLGTAVDAGGDADGDGVDDVLIGAPMDCSNGTWSGRVRLLSGKDGSQLLTLVGSASYDQFGFAVAFVGDVNGDGKDDFAVGAPGASPNGVGSGRVRIYSGANGAALKTLNGAVAGNTFGRAIARVGYVSAAYPHAFAVGAPYEDTSAGADAGAVYVFNGTTTAPISKVSGTFAGGHLGWSLAAADAFGIGVPYVLAGAPDFSQYQDHGGCALLFHPVTGIVARMHLGFTGVELGTSVACLSDLDNDACEDYALGAPLAYNQRGEVFIRGGTDGESLGILLGPSDGARFGSAIAGRIAIASSPNWHMAVGAPLDDQGGSDAGRIYLYRVSVPAGPPAVVWTRDGAVGEQLGSALAGERVAIANGSDVVVAGAPAADGTGANSGRVRLLASATGAVLTAIEGASLGEQLGASVCAVGDVNGDGVPDYGVGSPRMWASAGLGFIVSSGGAASIRSGANGAVLRYIDGSAEGDQLGTAIAGTGDVNGDGTPDWIVGAPFATSATATDAGEAFVQSGASSATLLALNGTQTGSQFGAALAAGDMNHDGTPDFAVGIPGYKNGPIVEAGLVRVCSGKNGTTLLDIFGSSTNEHFGAAVAMGDVNGDGWSDIVAGIPGRDVSFPDQGQIFVVSGKTTGIMWSSTGTAANDKYGSAVAVVGDVNGDGLLDVAIGAPEADILSVMNVGYVRVLNGATGATLWTAVGGMNSFFGASISGAGDVDLDGHADVLIGAHEYAFILPSGNGSARLFSGATGKLIHTTVGPEIASGFGFAVAGLGDANGDGIPDAVVGSPYEGPNDPLVWQGGARLVSLRPAGVSFYGASTAGCAGPQLLTATTVPKVNTPGYAFACNHAPASALGLLLIGNAQDLAGTNFLGLGVSFHVDLLASTFLTGINMPSNAAGYGLGPAPIPNDPSFAGIALYAQTLWVETACAVPPFNLSATSAVAYTIQ